MQIDFPGDGLISAIIAVNQRASTGHYDVGVLAENGGCDAPEHTVHFHMDDEDRGNGNRWSNWQGASRQDGNGTDFVFCRVDGSKLHTIAPSPGDPRSADYAVLRLGDECPLGSFEFQRFISNERNNNGNFIIGDAWPNRQNWEGQGVGTLLRFCEFQPEFAPNDPQPPMTKFPAFAEAPFGYGVFARPSFLKAIAKGDLHTDDQDYHNNGAFKNDDYPTATRPSSSMSSSSVSISRSETRASAPARPSIATRATRSRSPSSSRR